MDYPSLPAHVGQLRHITDLLRPTVHIAQTARGKSHSGLLVRLEKAECAQPQWHEHHGAPASGYADAHEHAGEQDGGCE